MKLEHFGDLISREKARELTLKLYDYANNCKHYGLKDRIIADAEQVMCLLASGFYKSKPELIANFKESVSYLYKIESRLHLFFELGAIDSEQFLELQNICSHIHKMVSAFIKSCIAK